MVQGPLTRLSRCLSHRVALVRRSLGRSWLLIHVLTPNSQRVVYVETSTSEYIVLTIPKLQPSRCKSYGIADRVLLLTRFHQGPVG